MNKAINIVTSIMENEENYDKWGLTFPEHIREWKEFNMLIGENGAGKSRILQMIEHNAKRQCIVIHLDFSTYIRPQSQIMENSLHSDKCTLIKRLFFNEKEEESFDNSIYLNFLKHLGTQILPICNELFRMTNNEMTIVREEAEYYLDKLKPTIQEILHREIKLTEDGICLCKGHREVTLENEWNLLSPGEWNILLVIFAVLFINLVQKRNPCILLIDELETHLHPHAQLKLYELLKQGLDKSNANNHCTCIASHSIFLLPHFDIHELAYTHNGRIEKINGGLYQQIYDNLTGEGSRDGESLTDFFFSMSAWQYADYLAECFLAPTNVDTASNTDQQALQFVTLLQQMYQSKEKISVLDYGAGSGRIGKCIELMLKDKTNTKKIDKLIKKIKYNVYDKYCITFDFKENTDWVGEAYDHDKIHSVNGKFDIILLYNVLHEISIDEWVRELRFMLDLLSEDGLLLFGEREILSIGEKPYGKSGYLVLGKEELADLFPHAVIQEVIVPEIQRKTTICFAIKKPPARNVYPRRDNVRNALKTLRKNTRSKIKNRDKNGLGERDQSRKYAFYCQQYFNADEAIEIINKEEKSSKISQGNNNDTQTALNDFSTIKTEAMQSILSYEESPDQVSMPEPIPSDTEKNKIPREPPLSKPVSL